MGGRVGRGGGGGAAALGALARGVQRGAPQALRGRGCLVQRLCREAEVDGDGDDDERDKESEEEEEENSRRGSDGDGVKSVGVVDGGDNSASFLRLGRVPRGRGRDRQGRRNRGRGPQGRGGVEGRRGVEIVFFFFFLSGRRQQRGVEE